MQKPDSGQLISSFSLLVEDGSIRSYVYVDREVMSAWWQEDFYGDHSECWVCVGNPEKQIELCRYSTKFVVEIQWG